MILKLKCCICFNFLKLWARNAIPRYLTVDIVCLYIRAVGILEHERGHVEQIRELGGFGYLKDIGIPSIYNVAENDLEKKWFGGTVYSIDHEEFYTETDANIKAFWLYGDNFHHSERTKQLVTPTNPLIGRVSKYDVMERLYLQIRDHWHGYSGYTTIPSKK